MVQRGLLEIAGSDRYRSGRVGSRRRKPDERVGARAWGRVCSAIGMKPNFDTHEVQPESEQSVKRLCTTAREVVIPTTECDLRRMYNIDAFGV